MNDEGTNVDDYEAVLKFVALILVGMLIILCFWQINKVQDTWRMKSCIAAGKSWTVRAIDDGSTTRVIRTVCE